MCEAPGHSPPHQHLCPLMKGHGKMHMSDETSQYEAQFGVRAFTCCRRFSSALELLHHRCRRSSTVRHLTPPRHTRRTCKSAEERWSGCESTIGHTVTAVVETRAVESRMVAIKVVGHDLHENVRKPCVKPHASRLVDASIFRYLCTSVASACSLFPWCTRAPRRSCLNHVLQSRHILCRQRHH